ncbi:MAG: vWA domain-containing protein [Chloroflexota bacterium]
MKRRLIALGNILVLIALLASITACGGSESRSATEFAQTNAGDSPAGTGSEAPKSPSMMATSTTGAGDDTAAMSLSNPLLNSESGPASSEPVPPGAVEGVVGGGDITTGKSYNQQNQAPPLTAGQVDDNAKFADYIDYLRTYGRDNYMGSVEPVDVSQRLFVRVLDGSQQPVAGARVQLFDGSKQVFDGRTVSDGRILFFPSAAGATQAQQFHAVISRGQSTVEATVQAGTTEQIVPLTGLTDNNGPVGIDLVFLLDATGSMGDEIGKIKATVGSIASRIEQMPGSSAPRFGLVAFRDRGDDYVTRSWNFTSNIEEFSSNLSNVNAGGGGDTPESLNEGLHEAINLPGWADTSTGRRLRLIVLVGDAPPHTDYANDYSYTALVQDAVAAGIKIFPVGASNLDGAGEYVFRQLAEMTQGQFVFLTYANGVSGSPGLSTDKHVEDFTVQNLDALIVNLVAGEVANLTGQRTGASDNGPVTVVVPVAANVNAGSPSLAGIAAFMDDFVGGRGGIFWAALLVIVAAVVLSAGKQVRARVAQPQTQEQSPEIYLPESGPAFHEPVEWQIAVQPERTDHERVMAAHLQPTINPVEVYMDVQPTRHPTVPLG